MNKITPLPDANRNKIWADQLASHQAGLDSRPSMVVEGKLMRMVGLTLEAVGCQAAIGELCNVEVGKNNFIEAEVVGFSGESLYLMPTGSVRGIVPNSRVIPTGRVYEAAVGEALLGRVLDGTGRPLDGAGPLQTTARMPLTGRPVNPLSRSPVDEQLDVGIRAINSLFSVGRGQRLGLFAGSGVGKSALLGMMARYTDADVVVVGLIGESGRKVKEFIEKTLGPEGMLRTVVVAASADTTPVMRLHGASMATCIAEYFRDQGMNVLLLMDSLTGFAQAQREVSLAIGEAPVTNGYPPSVFANISQLVERAGTGDRGGSITAFYTVLTEGDGPQDPIAEISRAVLDGHIVLSRHLAETGIYPAIDLESSISHVMSEITSEEKQMAARHFKQQYFLYQKNRNLINAGACVKGINPELDAAITMYPYLTQFLQQDVNQPASVAQSYNDLADVIRRSVESA